MIIINYIDHASRVKFWHGDESFPRDVVCSITLTEHPEEFDLELLFDAANGYAAESYFADVSKEATDRKLSMSSGDYVDVFDSSGQLIVRHDCLMSGWNSFKP